MFGPIRTLCLAAALYLPLAFFVWFAFAAALCYPIGPMAGMVLHNWMPELILSFARDRFGVDFQTSLFVNQATQALSTSELPGTNVAWISTNPMIFGYGLPVAVGLILATPLTIARRFKQILISVAVIWLVQTNGVIWEALQIMYFKWGQVGADAMFAQGLSPTMVAFGYQFSYLMLPPLAPVVLWIVLNRSFINDLTKLDHIESLDDYAERPASVESSEQSPDSRDHRAPK